MDSGATGSRESARAREVERAMATTVTRVGDDNWTQVTTGDRPNSVSIDMTAKGQATISLKLTYNSAAEMATNVAEEINAVLSEVKRALASQNISLAGAATAAEGK